MVNRSIKIQGTGIVEQTPDIINLFFNVENKDYTYIEATNKVNMRTEELKNKLQEVDIPKENLKTTFYNIDTSHRFVNGKNIFDGYLCRHDLELELPLDNDIIKKVLSKIVSSGIDVSFSMSFGVKDKETLKNRVLENGVKDALKKAEILSKAAGVKLGQIISISHGWNEVRVHSDMNLRMEKMALASASMPDITPRDIKASDYVNVEWEIE